MTRPSGGLATWRNRSVGLVLPGGAGGIAVPDELIDLGLGGSDRNKQNPKRSIGSHREILPNRGEGPCLPAEGRRNKSTKPRISTGHARRSGGEGGRAMGTLLLILVVLLLLGGLVPWGGPAVPGSPGPVYHGYGYGWSAGGILGAVLLVLLILALMGRV